MINFMISSQVKLGGLILLAALFLQGCGGERTTPYNPSSSSSSSSSSSAASVSVSIIAQGTFTSGGLDHEDKRLQVMRDADDFYDITNNYVNSNLPQPNFSEGQAILVDLGNVNGCAQHLNFSSLRAEKAGADSVKVVVSYTESAANTAGCSTAVTRPYQLYYVESRGSLLVEEKIL